MKTYKNLKAKGYLRSPYFKLSKNQRYRTTFEKVTKYVVDSYSYASFSAEDSVIYSFDKPAQERWAPMKVISKNDFIRRVDVKKTKK